MGMVMLIGLVTTANAVQINLQQKTIPISEASRRSASIQPAVTVGAVVPAPTETPLAKESTEDPDVSAKGRLSVIISLDKQQLTLYSDGQPIGSSRVSTGQPGHDTPTGVFSIIQKDQGHHSNVYDDAPMYFMQRITWSGLAMHQGFVPNYPASHGCIRLPEAFARQLWGITKLGVRVIIVHGNAEPVAIEAAPVV